jgi:hypothetical protein
MSAFTYTDRSFGPLKNLRKSGQCGTWRSPTRHRGWCVSSRSVTSPPRLLWSAPSWPAETDKGFACSVAKLAPTHYSLVRVCRSEIRDPIAACDSTAGATLRLRVSNGAPPSGAYLILNGRRWRRSPALPAPLGQELVNELMSPRLAVGAAVHVADENAAGARVHDAKLALGERGRAWWLVPTARRPQSPIDAPIRALLRGRREDASICPSDVARAVGGPSMPDAAAGRRSDVGRGGRGQAPVQSCRWRTVSTPPSRSTRRRPASIATASSSTTTCSSTCQSSTAIRRHSASVQLS